MLFVMNFSAVAVDILATFESAKELSRISLEVWTEFRIKRNVSFSVRKKIPHLHKQWQNHGRLSLKAYNEQVFL